jgi:murein DD-endopeptidase MepM/ murein hydrolase activator NlpD
MGGELWTTEQFAIDFIELGPNRSTLNGSGPLQVPTSWWGYGTPVLAVASGVVIEAVDGIPDTLPVGSNPNIQDETASGNHVMEDIGGGRYVEYEHLKPHSVAVKVGQKVQVGQLLGKVGTSGNSYEPHLHFQVIDRPQGFKAHGLPFVFDTQLLEGRVPPAYTNGEVSKVDACDVVPIDRTGGGVKRNLMPSRNDVLGLNLSR